MSDTSTKTVKKKDRVPQPVTAYKAVDFFMEAYALSPEMPISDLLEALRGAIVKRAIG